MSDAQQISDEMREREEEEFLQAVAAQKRIDLTGLQVRRAWERWQAWLDQSEATGNGKTMNLAILDLLEQM